MYYTQPVAARMKSLPRWSDFNHFDAIMNVSFTDGSKHEDISKVNFRMLLYFLNY